MTRPGITGTARCISGSRCMSAMTTSRLSRRASRASWPGTNRWSLASKARPLWPVLSIALAAAAMIGPVGAQTPVPGGVAGPAPNTGAVYIITYFEVGDGAAKQTADVLRQFAAATRKEDGNTGFVALEE